MSRGYDFFYPTHGFISFDAAASNFISGALPYRDSEMQDSKGELSEDTAGVATASVENYLLGEKLLKVEYLD